MTNSQGALSDSLVECLCLPGSCLLLLSLLSPQVSSPHMIPKLRRDPPLFPWLLLGTRALGVPLQLLIHSSALIYSSAAFSACSLPSIHVVIAPNSSCIVMQMKAFVYCFQNSQHHQRFFQRTQEEMKEQPHLISLHKDQTGGAADPITCCRVPPETLDLSAAMCQQWHTPGISLSTANLLLGGLLQAGADFLFLMDLDLSGAGFPPLDFVVIHFLCLWTCLICTNKWEFINSL